MSLKFASVTNCNLRRHDLEGGFRTLKPILSQVSRFLELAALRQLLE